MTTISNTFEGGTAGARVTTAASGGVSGTATSGSSGFATTDTNTCTFDNARAAHGTVSMKMVFSTTALAFQLWNFASTIRTVARFYVYLPSLPATTQFNLATFRNATGTMMTAAISTTGRLMIIDSTGTVITGSAATAVFPTAQWVRVELAVTKGTTTTNGVAEWRYYLGDSSTAVQTYSSTAVNTGTTDVAGIRLGTTPAATTGYTIWYDLQVSDLATGFIGAPTNPLTIASNDRLTFIIQSTGTAANGGALSYTIAQTAGTTTTPTNTDVGRWEVVPDSTATLSYSVTLSEASGGSASTPVDVPATNTGGTAAPGSGYEVELLYFTGSSFV
jgi:hypothetical protein